MLLEGIEVVGHQAAVAFASAEERERAYDVGVDRFLPGDGPAGLDVAVQPRRQRLGILTARRPDEEVLPVADRACSPHARAARRGRSPRGANGT